MQAGHQVGGADLVLTSDVPVGRRPVLLGRAGVRRADRARRPQRSRYRPPLDRARLARRAENDFVGAPTGLMDQAASMLCTAGHALFFDCRSHDASRCALDLGAAGLEILVLDTRTPHALVDSEYATRRASCEEAARLLGVPALRDVSDLDDALWPRCRTR